MIQQLAIAGYRSLRDVSLALGPLNIVTGANGTGKSGLYRALRLLGDVAQGRLIASIAREGGLDSTLWAGPETITGAMRRGEHPIQGTRRSGAISLRLGFAAEDFGYAIDLGLPTPPTAFARDPEIKVEAMWSGAVLGRANLYAERRGPGVRGSASGEWRQLRTDLAPYDSMVMQCADAEDGLEMLLMRDRMRGWRFYDSLRIDAAAPARQPQVRTFTPVLADDGGDVAAAIETIRWIGDGHAFDDAIDDAFPGSTVVLAGDEARASIAMTQRGLLRALDASELSDGTLRYLLLAAALHSPRPPELMILNEPEASLHPDLLEPLARLLAEAARRCQIVVVSHAERLVDALRDGAACAEFTLSKAFGETVIDGPGADHWAWPTR